MAEDSNELEGLREVPVSEILAKIEKGEPVEYESIIIRGNLDIKELNLQKNNGEIHIKSPIKIINSQIKGDVIFDEAIFEGLVDFEATQLSEYVYFIASRFTKNSNFSGTQFNGDVDFKDAKFDADADFDGAQFRGDACFYDAQLRQCKLYSSKIYLSQ